MRYRIGVQFHDKNMHIPLEYDDQETDALSTMCHLFRTYAGVKFGYVVDQETKDKDVYLPDGTYMFTVPLP